VKNIIIVLGSIALLGLMGCGEDGQKGLNLNPNSGSTDNSTPLLQEPAPGTISQATFDKIQKGMTYSEVVALIGSPEATDVSPEFNTARWTNQAPNFGMVVITFKDDKVFTTLGMSLK
jgi:hypothetical protein